MDSLRTCTTATSAVVVAVVAVVAAAVAVVAVALLHHCPLLLVKGRVDDAHTHLHKEEQ